MNTNDERFLLNGMIFEFDKEKNKLNIEKHGISFEIAARVFSDYNRIEIYDAENSLEEDRFDTIGDISFCIKNKSRDTGVIKYIPDEYLLFVVYTERYSVDDNNGKIEITRIISARPATKFERGLYYGKGI